MGRKGHRKRIAKRCYEDGSGRSYIVRDPRTGKPKEFRFPPHTAVATMRDEAERWLAKHRGSRRVVSVRGTLNAAIDRWQSQEQHLASWKERRAELRAWAALYGEKQLRSITEEDCRKAMSIWATTDLETVKRKRPASPKTIRNRLWTLKHLFRVMLGPDAETPVDHIDPPAKVRTLPTHISPAVILKVYAKLLEMEQRGRLRDAKTRARFMVRASTGRRPCEIMWTEPKDVNLERRVWNVPDGKGGWSEGLYLNDDMLAAWQLFIEANAWGEFDTGSMAEVLRHCGWPDTVRPYNLRHSLGIDLSESGADLHDVGPWLGHKNLQTTRSVYVPVLNSRMQRLSTQINGRLGGWNVPSPSPSVESAEPGKVRQTKGRAPKHKTA